MTKEEIYNAGKIAVSYDRQMEIVGKEKADTVLHFWKEGVLSDTARKHWGPKWIPVTGEGLPKESKMYIVRSSDSELPFVDFFKSDLEMFDFDIRHKFTSKRITHYSPLPTFND